MVMELTLVLAIVIWIFGLQLGITMVNGVSRNYFLTLLILRIMKVLLFYPLVEHTFVHIIEEILI